MAKKKVALVLSGGGARGAYQAGVLKAWEDVFRQGGKVDIITGVSAGSVNALKLVEKADDFPDGVDQMIKLWISLNTEDIFESNLRTLARKAFSLIRSSRLGWAKDEGSIGQAILDSSPFQRFLKKNFNMDEVHRQLRENPSLVLAITCFDYSDRKNVTFFETEGPASNWERETRCGIRTTLSSRHIMASCSVPVIFPTIKIGEHYCGDGSLRNIAPLHPAILLEAERIICIKLNCVDSMEKAAQNQPTLGTVAGAIFQSLVMDSVEYDAKILNRISGLTRLIPEKKRDFREIDLCLITPQFDFNSLAQDFQSRFPKSLRYLFGGWLTADLLSFLMFEGEFCEILIEKGYQDGKKYVDTVSEWLLG